MGKSVNLEWQGDPPVFYCPVCGKDIITSEGESDVWCNHIKFLYIYETGEFYKMDKTYESLLTENDYNSDEDIVELLMKKVDSKSAIALNFTTNGVACGPMSSTVAFGLDFDPNK